MDKRLIYRVVLKLLFLFLLVVLAVVFINSLFTQSTNSEAPQKALSVVQLDVSGMIEGNVRKVRWEGKEVNTISLGDNNFFTYINVGDSGNCPLFKETNGLKDICTGTRFDFSGKQKDKDKHGFMLKTPPNFYENNTIFIGANHKKK